MDLLPMFFRSWDPLARILIVGGLSYLGLLLLLRASGKRTLSKMSAFDFVVTVALGSILASTLVSKSVTLADGVVGFAILIGLQFLITWLSERAAVRAQGIAAMAQVEAVVLEMDGSFTVLQPPSSGAASALADVAGASDTGDPQGSHD